MAANKKPRKKYRPRGTLHDPLTYVLTGFTRLSDQSAVKLKITNHAAMAALTNGTAVKNDWDLITNALNMAVVLAESGIGDEYVQPIRKGMLAHAHCGQRLQKHGKFGYTGEQLTAVNLALEVHDAQLDTATVGEMEQAQKEVLRRLAAKKIEYTVKELA